MPDNSVWDLPLSWVHRYYDQFSTKIYGDDHPFELGDDPYFILNFVSESMKWDKMSNFLVKREKENLSLMYRENWENAPKTLNRKG